MSRRVVLPSPIPPGVVGAGGTPPRIHTRIQHHPSRDHLIVPLIEALEWDVEVVTDPDPEDRFPSPWRTYRECLYAPPSDATHLLVLQDDVIPCRNLVGACARIAEAVPDDPVAVYLGGSPVRTATSAARALASGQRFVRVIPTEFVPVVALLWPVDVAQAFLDWCGENRLPGDPRPRSDDAVVGKWARTTKQMVWACVPSLVQHPDEEPSLIRRRQSMGRSMYRTAFSWIGEADPLEIDWRMD